MAWQMVTQPLKPKKMGEGHGEREGAEREIEILRFLGCGEGQSLSFCSQNSINALILSVSTSLCFSPHPPPLIPIQQLSPQLKDSLLFQSSCNAFGQPWVPSSKILTFPAFTTSLITYRNTLQEQEKWDVAPTGQKGRSGSRLRSVTLQVGQGPDQPYHGRGWEGSPSFREVGVLQFWVSIRFHNSPSEVKEIRSHRRGGDALAWRWQKNDSCCQVTPNLDT